MRSSGERTTEYGARHQGGFTLVEIMISLALVVILGAMLAPVLFTAGNSFSRLDNNNREQLICRGIYDFVVDELRNADQVTIATHDRSLGKTISVESGRLYYDDEDLFGADFYNGMVLELYADADGTDAVKLRLRLLRSGEEVYALESSVKTMNVGIKGGSVTSEVGYDKLNPVISYR